jgi:prephenate dehydrogenase
MWRDIAIANRDALLNAIDLFSEHLGQLRQAVADEDAAGMQETFARAKAARDAFSVVLAEQGRGKKT